jgi:agmatinase
MCRFLTKKNYMKAFGDFSEEYTSLENSKIVILPVPYDGTSTWIKGADKGPEALLDASYNLEFYDIETDSEVYTKGIYTADAVTEKRSPELMNKAVEAQCNKFLDKDKFIVLLGGEHSVTYGSVVAHNKKYKNMSVLQLDAHSDLRPEYHGSPFNHACIMARVQELCPITQVGIRSMDSIEKPNVNPSTIFYAENIYNNKSWMDKVFDTLTENVYITIDLDVFDPSIMPSTGTPEPGGLLWYDVIELMQKVFKNKNVVGFDIVELCPNENEKSSDFLAAKLVYKMLSYKFV